MKVHQYIMMCAPIMGQMGAIEALKNGEDSVAEMVDDYNRRRRVIVSGLNEIGLECHMPKGAFYAFPSIISTGLSSEEFAEKLQREIEQESGTEFGVVEAHLFANIPVVTGDNNRDPPDISAVTGPLAAATEQRGRQER